MKTFYGGGTLGDVFIIGCKMYDYHQKTNESIKFHHYSIHSEMFPVIDELYKYFPYIKVDHVECKNKEKVLSMIKKNSVNNYLINSCAYGSSNDGPDWYRDPTFVRMEPFPKLNLPNIQENKINRVGIQVQNGTLGNRTFSINWIKKVIRYCNRLNNYEVVLFGQNYFYNKELERLKPYYKFTSLINKTNFHNWLGLINSCNIFITFEGFPAFFSMSQKIKTLMFNQYIYPIKNVHNEWRKKNIIVELNKNKVKQAFRYRLVKYGLVKNIPFSPPINHVINFISQ